MICYVRPTERDVAKLKCFIHVVFAFLRQTLFPIFGFYFPDPIQEHAERSPAAIRLPLRMSGHPKIRLYVKDINLAHQSKFESYGWSGPASIDHIIGTSGSLCQRE